MPRPHHLFFCALLGATPLLGLACAGPGGDDPDDGEAVGASDEELLVLATATSYGSLTIESAAQRSITLTYDCSSTRREIWRRLGNGAYRKVGDIPPCVGEGRFVDDGVKPSRPYCYRLRLGTGWTDRQACGRTAYDKCGTEGREWRAVSCAEGSDCVVRVEPGSCLDVRGAVKLDPHASYDAVEVRIGRSDVTLDCQGATLSGPYDAGTGITVTSPWTARTDPDVQLASCAEPPPDGLCQYAHPWGDPMGWAWQDTVTPVQNVRIQDCNVDGYRLGAKVELQGAWKQYTTDLITDEYVEWFRHPTEQQCRVGQIEDCLRDAAPRDVVFHGVNIRDSGKNGLHLRSYVHDTTFEDGSVHDAGGVGAYVSPGSRDNVIRDSSFRDNGREGIALDASAFNLVAGNTLVGNSHRILPEWEQPYGQAITVFRNAWENRFSSNPSGPRLQHAEGNVIERNEIRDHDEAIWIGFRQSTGRHSSTERGDPIYFTEDSSIPTVDLRYYRINAEDTVVRWNTISDFNRGVVVEDDRATVVGNWFAEGGSHAHQKGIDIGARVRRKAREPVWGAEVNGNVFVGDIVTPIRIHDCSYGNDVRDNWVLEDGAWTRKGASVGGCSGSQALLTGHLVGAGGEVAARSFVQRGGFFDDDRPWLAGDVDDDGLTDVVGVQMGSDARVRIWLHASSGDGLEHESSFQTFEPVRVPLGIITVAIPVEAGRWLIGDFDGVRGDDIAFLYGLEETRVRLWTSNGRGFEDPTDELLVDTPFTEPRRWLAGDVNGDGRADLVALHGESGDTVVDLHRSLGGGRFASALTQVVGAWNEDHRFLLGDVTGDDRADLVRVFAGSGGKALAWAQRSTGSGFTHAWLAWVSTTGTSSGAVDFLPYQRWLLADVSGDGQDDLVAITPVSGQTLIVEARSTAGGLAFHGSELLGGDLGGSAWLSGRFDCGSREDFVTVGPASSWGRPADVTAPVGPACLPSVYVGGTLGTLSGLATF